MLNYIIRRIFYIAIVFLVASVIVFSVFKMAPVDPVQMYTEGMAQGMTPADFERLQNQIRQELGLDQPLVIQYFAWMGKMLTGDFGRSLLHRRPVAEVIRAPMANTVRLNAITMIIVFAITIPLGITTAIRKGSLYDNTVQVVTILGISIPSFVTALIALAIFSVFLGWLPIGGVATPGFRGEGFEAFVDRARHMVLPVAVLVASSLAAITRYVRATMIDALRMDYIRTARAKGLKEKVVIYSHAFRNSLIPLVTVLVGWFISLLSGSVLVESIFSLNGMGREMVQAITLFDYGLALTVTMLYVLLGLIGNLIIDIAYTLVDPRIRLS
jgi:peptide/nickel transport system permease protein